MKAIEYSEKLMDYLMIFLFSQKFLIWLKSRVVSRVNVP